MSILTGTSEFKSIFVIIFAREFSVSIFVITLLGFLIGALMFQLIQSSRFLL